MLTFSRRLSATTDIAGGQTALSELERPVRSGIGTLLHEPEIAVSGSFAKPPWMITLRSSDLCGPQKYIHDIIGPQATRFCSDRTTRSGFAFDFLLHVAEIADWSGLLLRNSLLRRRQCRVSEMSNPHRGGYRELLLLHADTCMGATLVSFLVIGSDSSTSGGTVCITGNSSSAYP